MYIYNRIHRLEKDLYFYKKTSRDLKRKLRDLIASGTIRSQGMWYLSKKESPTSLYDLRIKSIIWRWLFVYWLVYKQLFSHISTGIIICQVFYLNMYFKIMLQFVFLSKWRYGIEFITKLCWWTRVPSHVQQPLTHSRLSQVRVFEEIVKKDVKECFCNASFQCGMKNNGFLNYILVSPL